MAIGNKIRKAVLRKANIEECAVSGINEVSRKPEELVSFLEAMIQSPNYFYTLLVDGKCSIIYRSGNGDKMETGADYAVVSYISERLYIRRDADGAQTDVCITPNNEKTHFSATVFPFNRKNNVIHIFAHGRNGAEASVYMDLCTNIYAIQTLDRKTAFENSNALFWRSIASEFGMQEMASAQPREGYESINPWHSITDKRTGNQIYIGTSMDIRSKQLDKEFRAEFQNPMPIAALEQMYSSPLEKFIDKKRAMAFVDGKFISARTDLPEDGMARKLELHFPYSLEKDDFAECIRKLLF
ncbi:MAG: hypothetical protein AABX27_04395 [Nanoarchaeota archaeon]